MLNAFCREQGRPYSLKVQKLILWITKLLRVCDGCVTFAFSLEDVLPLKHNKAFRLDSIAIDE